MDIDKKPTIEERVKDVIVAQLEVKLEEIKLESNFIDDLGADSLDTIELLMALEEEFCIEISDDEADLIRTVGGAVELIKKYVGGE